MLSPAPNQPIIVRVALDVPLPRLFDYICAANNGEPAPKVQLGCRVVVPFAGRQMVGIVLDILSESDVPADKLKSVLRVFDDVPFDEACFNLMQFCADYYHTPLGTILLSALPLRLRQTEPASSRKMWVYALQKPIPETLITKKQVVLQRIVALLQATTTVDESVLRHCSATWRKALQPLIDQGYVRAQEVLAMPATMPSSAEVPTLNDEQAQAVEAILAQRDHYQPWLLYGVTGSGKTEVYIRLLEAVLAEPQAQVLVLVPEINLTPQLEARFRTRLSQFPLVTLHSRLSESERLQHWQAAQSGQARIVIGTRLSIFTPMPHLKLMILDEEHDSSYKQQEGMRYHARDVALVRAKQANIPIVLGSATPSLETWYKATGKAGAKQPMGLLTLTQRAVSAAKMPRLHCIDSAKSPLEEGLSPILKQAIAKRLEAGEQSLLFINRRGYAPVLHCSACGWLADCRRCSAKVVFHMRQRRLKCHHCGDEQRVPLQCPSCGNPDLRPVGQATQRIEEQLQVLFPEARIARVDRDSMQKKQALTDLLSQVHAGDIDILIGTQMLAKGHDFPNLTLVGVLDTDSALYSPDFRASERLFAQLMQVAGRAGRGEKAGEVLIQTAFPQHALFEALRQHDYTSFANQLLDERIAMQFPPACYFAVLRAEAEHYSNAETFLNANLTFARTQLGAQTNKSVMVYEPIRPSLARLNKMERGYILMQSTQRVALQNLLREIVQYAQQLPSGKKVRWGVDVDPLEI